MSALQIQFPFAYCCLVMIEMDEDTKENEESNLQIRRRCKYLGCFAVAVTNEEERNLFVNEKLEELEKTKTGTKVIFLLEIDKILVYDENETQLKLICSMNDVAFTTCSADIKQFALVTKGPHTLQAHIFRMKKKSHIKHLGVTMSRAFMRCSALKAKIMMKSDPLQAEGNRRWAKREVAYGHVQSEHAIQARRNTLPPDLKGADILKHVAEQNMKRCFSSSQA
eukprot:gene3497-4000_t